MLWNVFQWSCDCVTGLLIDFTTPTCREIGTDWWTVWLSDWLTDWLTDQLTVVQLIDRLLDQWSSKTIF